MVKPVNKNSQVFILNTHNKKQQNNVKLIEKIVYYWYNYVDNNKFIK